MKKIYYQSGSNTYQVVKEGDNYLVYRLKNNATSRMRAWEFLKRYIEESDYTKDMIVYLKCLNEDNIKSKEVTEEKVDSLIDSYIMYNS